jgi:hypothetical protein
VYGCLATDMSGGAVFAVSDRVASRCHRRLGLSFLAGRPLPDLLPSSMPRRSRIDFEEAIDHAMARRNARQKIVRDDADRRWLIDGLEQTVVCSDWELPHYVVSWPRGGFAVTAFGAASR